MNIKLYLCFFFIYCVIYILRYFIYKGESSCNNYYVIFIYCQVMPGTDPITMEH